MDTTETLPIEELLQDNEQTLILRPIGDIMASNCDQFRNRAMKATKEAIQCLTLDLSGVQFIDSTGLGVLMGLKSTCTKHRIQFVLSDVTPPVIEILRLTRIDRFFTFA